LDDILENLVKRDGSGQDFHTYLDSLMKEIHPEGTDDDRLDNSKLHEMAEKLKHEDIHEQLMKMMPEGFAEEMEKMKEKFGDISPGDKPSKADFKKMQEKMKNFDHKKMQEKMKNFDHKKMQEEMKKFDFTKMQEQMKDLLGDGDFDFESLFKDDL
jgi:Glu-tRNA(Gln) amidotransferase subunit E-like FAD-binding protein